MNKNKIFYCHKCGVLTNVETLDKETSCTLTYDKEISTISNNYPYGTFTTHIKKFTIEFGFVPLVIL